MKYRNGNKCRLIIKTIPPKLKTKMKSSLASEKLFEIAVRLHEQNPAHRSNIRRSHKWNHKTISNLLCFPTSVLLIMKASGNAKMVAPITTSTPRSIEFRKIPANPPLCITSIGFKNSNYSFHIH